MPKGQSVDCGGGTATLSGDGGTLELEEAEIQSHGDSATPLEVFGGELNIVLVGDNAIQTTGGICAINGGLADLTFSGEGSLLVEAVDDAVCVFDGSVAIDGAGVIINSIDGMGLMCTSGAVSITDDAAVTVKSYDTAIYAEGGLSISDSTVTATSNGSGTGVVYSDMDIHISNSTVSATGTGAGPAIEAYGDITITGGSNATVTSGNYGIYTDSDMAIDASTVTAEGTTDEGMSVQGSLTISDSTVTVTGWSSPVTPAIYTKSLEISGASEVTCCGGVSATQSLVVAPAQGILVDVMVGASASEAQHFDGGGVTSPLSGRTDFSDLSEWGLTALDWLRGYTYLRIGEHVHVFDQEVVADRYKAADATCTDAATYRYSCVCEEMGTDTFAFGDPLGHEWGEPAWVWAEDFSQATATFACGNDPSHTQAETVKAMSEVTTPATCTEDGTTTYTASVSFNGQQYRDVKEAADVPALGHAWGEPAWIWAEDYSSATATFACRRDASHTLELAAEVSSVTTDPTATEAGCTVYTATVELGGSSHTDTRTVVIPATGTTPDEPDQTDEPDQARDPDDGQTDGGVQADGGAQADGEDDGAPLPKTGDGSGIAPLLASALAAMSACGGVLVWRRSRRVG